MKILVTGAGGGLGHDLQSVFSDDELVLLDRSALDITDADRVNAAVLEAKPETIIHTAAYTNVDGAEDEPAQAMLVNEQGTANVAKAARAIGAALVYPSTDYVFDGEKRQPYSETDFAKPLSVYGASKLRGEEAALNENPRTFVVRTSWLYSQTGKSFATTMLRLFGEKSELSIVADEISSPTYAPDFARGLQALLQRKDTAPGIYHASGGGFASWFEYAQEIAHLAGAKTQIKPTTAAQWGAKAVRPKYSKLDCGKIGQLGIELSDWKAALAEFFADRP